VKVTRLAPQVSLVALKATARQFGRIAAAAAVALLVMAPKAHADSVTYTIPDIGSFKDFSSSDTSATFSGTGFVGLYGPRVGDGFNHLFGIELDNFSRTELNVDVSGLAGSTINSAFLSFDLKDGFADPQTVTATSFDANGALGYSFDAPSNLGTGSYPVNGLASNSLDVTSLLTDRISANQDWFGLYLQGSTVQQSTYAYDFPTSSILADRANVRLTVDYTPCVTPEPGSMALLATGVLPLLGFRRRRRA
jgi:hypothetical protein